MLQERTRMMSSPCERCRATLGASRSSRYDPVCSGLCLSIGRGHSCPARLRRACQGPLFCLERALSPAVMQAGRLPCFACRTVDSRLAGRPPVLLSIAALGFNLLPHHDLKIARSLMLMGPFLPWQSMQAVWHTCVRAWHCHSALCTELTWCKTQACHTAHVLTCSY